MLLIPFKLSTSPAPVPFSWKIVPCVLQALDMFPMNVMIQTHVIMYQSCTACALCFWVLTSETAAWLPCASCTIHMMRMLMPCAAGTGHRCGIWWPPSWTVCAQSPVCCCCSSSSLSSLPYLGCSCLGVGSTLMQHRRSPGATLTASGSLCWQYSRYDRTWPYSKCVWLWP